MMRRLLLSIALVGCVGAGAAVSRQATAAPVQIAVPEMAAPGPLVQKAQYSYQRRRAWRREHYRRWRGERGRGRRYRY
jgi:hypothetical protein